MHILSKRPETAGIHFIFLTAKSEKADMRKGMNLGADDYLTKPFEEMELLDAVESRLRKSEVIRKEFSQDIEGLNQFYEEASAFKELKDLSQQRKLKTFRKNADIFLEGSLCQALYFINRGRVKTYKTTKDGKDFVTNILGPGDFLGYMALLGKTVYTESVTALEAVEVCLISQEDFFRLLYGNWDVAAKFIKMLSRNLVEREKQLLQISYHSVRQRVAEALLKLAQTSKETDSPSGITIAHKDLASITGAAKETITRTLA